MSDADVKLFTDGACLGNPGPGGWAAILKWNGHEKELSGGLDHTTNNQMELQAAISGLQALIRPMNVTIITDSKYVMNGITSWMDGWKRNGWKTASKKPVANQELWQELDAACQRHNVRWEWVKGHAGHTENERCDTLARSEAEALQT